VTFNIGGSAFSAAVPPRRHPTARIADNTTAMTSEQPLFI
jgi:hypothetical protein